MLVGVWGATLVSAAEPSATPVADLPPELVKELGGSIVFFHRADVTRVLPARLSLSGKRHSPQDLPGFRVEGDSVLKNLPVISVPFGVYLQDKDPSDDVIRELLRQKNLRHVHSWRCQLSALKALSKHPGIRSVSFSDPKLGERGVPSDADLAAALTGFTELESLDLFGAEILGPKTMSVIGSHPTLRHLHVGDSKAFDDTAAAPLAKLTGLRSLIVRGNFKLGTESAKLIGGMKDLEVLDTELCSGLGTDAALAEFGKCRKLRCLHATGSRVTDAGAKSIGELMNLESLRITDFDAVKTPGYKSLAKCTLLRELSVSGAHKLDADGLAALGSLSNLERLRILFLDTSGPTGWKAIAALPRLRELSLDTAHHLIDEDVRPLFGCSKLEKLRIKSCDMLTDTAFIGLSAVKSLTDVEIDFCPKVGDATARELAKLPKIRLLSLAGCGGVTDAGAKALSQTKTLTDVNLGYGTKVTDVGGDALKSALPGSNVRW
jgi:hypothetical protein